MRGLARLTRSLCAIVLVSMAAVANAEKRQVDGNLLLTSLDAGGNDEFKSGNAIAINYNHDFKNWLAADLGLLVTDKTLEESRQDIVGYYRSNIRSQALLLGVKPRHRFQSPYEVFGRLGLQLWRTELEVEEYFGEGIPEGADSEKDTGYGYYLSIGGAHYVTDRVLVQLEFRHFKQLDVFQGKTAYPFDLAINALSLGVGYRF
jgi:opacity protein-like surface antigen